MRLGRACVSAVAFVACLLSRGPASPAAAAEAMREEGGMGVVSSLSDAPIRRDVAGVGDLRSLLRPGEIPAFGDLVRTSRFFGSWVLACDRLLSRDGQMCWLENRAPSAGGDLLVRLELAVDSRPVVVVRLPGDSSPSFGGRVISGSVDVPLGPLACEPSSCRSVSAMGGPLEAAFSGVAPVDVVFERGGRRFAARVALDGFAEAVRSLSVGGPSR